MDRNLVYPGAIPLDTDLLMLNRNAMMAVGFLTQAVLGTGPLFDGLACGPTTPASMQVVVGPGSMVSLQTVDATAYGSLAADPLDALVKLGINLVSTTFTLTAPASAGQSIDYLIEAAFLEADSNPVVLPYYNAANPAVPYTGPTNSGVAQNTQRAQRVQLQLKAGMAANTGTQTPPPVDAGWTGLYVATVAYGQTTVTAPNISIYAGAPFIGAKLPALAPLAALVASIQGGRLLNVQMLNTPGTSAYAATAGTNSVIVDVVGAGAPGAGTAATGASQAAASSGGGAGAHARARLTTGFNGATVVVGAAGIAAAGATGTAGGQSAFGAVVAPGGAVGQVGIATGVSMITSPGSASAAPVGGNIHQGRGDVGERGIVLDPTGSSYPSGGFGGQSPLDSTLDGPGAGGSGVQAVASIAAQAGLPAQNGAVIIYEFS